ncbi:uncharacterized protein FOMMEDRAFT_154043 [Fomitiporia mediterranea MF3/22]|uniref:uncharacterized protein n=1 Tax=Fomitiporia mediterranea (strain MF3/22) TaxID=694068 RepID=UPI0004408698|nr:uncharacterized protein FOMMEDRAFT_154043 [Fomitiporia mediterranea MF3/22]EJD04897.1 hypothetical protein FOMMEDRAFT_154043 [Fomitiporia mediterranea MF3/22]
MQNNRGDATPTLPNDVLRTIFLNFVSNNSENTIPRPSRTSPPLNLSWVNRQWRDVALSTPELWTAIALPNERERRTNPDPDPTTGDIELLKLYISRSGEELPFSFALDYGGVSNRGSNIDVLSLQKHIDGINRLVSVMDSVRHRWRVIVVRCRSVEALGSLLTSLALGAPKLEHLLISTTPNACILTRTEEETDMQVAQYVLDVSACPKLESIVLQSPELQVDPFISEKACLRSLKSLALNYSTSQPDAFTWLQCAPFLETAFIQLINAPPFALPHALPLLLPYLTRLSLVCLSGDSTEVSNPSSFLELLRLPELKTFELIMDGALGTNQGWPHALNMIRRSNPDRDFETPLEELELLGTPMATSEFIDMLSLVPGLKKLTIDDALASDEVMLRLSTLEADDRTPVPGSIAHEVSANTRRGQVQQPLCPELETLVLHACSASLSVLANMASSRCRLNAQPQGTGDGASYPESTPSEETSGNRTSNMQNYRTLKKLELVHSYRNVPPITENPLFSRCLDYGLTIVQRPRTISRL